MNCLAPIVPNGQSYRHVVNMSEGNIAVVTWPAGFVQDDDDILWERIPNKNPLRPIRVRIAGPFRVLGRKYGGDGQISVRLSWLGLGDKEQRFDFMIGKMNTRNSNDYNHSLIGRGFEIERGKGLKFLTALRSVETSSVIKSSDEGAASAV